MLKIGLIKEGKTPPDSRVAFSPAQCAYLENNFDLKFLVEPSSSRCFQDKEYIDSGVTVSSNMGICDILMGVKEVPINQLIADKKYFFFSHTIKEQPYNRDLLLAILHKKITLLDYEVLTNKNGRRLSAFGFYAGVVGAYNGIYAYGKRSGSFDLKRLKDCRDYAEAQNAYPSISFPAIKVVLTGTGRVASGARKVLEEMGFDKVTPTSFLKKNYSHPVFTQLTCKDYASPKDGSAFKKEDFYARPESFKSIFSPYTKVADVMINGIFWDNRAPAFFTLNDMRESDFSIEVVADITCDIAPAASIPATIRPSTIADPVFGFDPSLEQEIEAYQSQGVDIMSVDNLPNELPRDASVSFGQQLIDNVMPAILRWKDPIITRGTVASNGELGPHFQYLRAYVDGQ